MHAADRAALIEPAFAAGRVDHPAARRAFRPGHPLEDGRTDTAADPAGGATTIHVPIIADRYPAPLPPVCAAVPGPAALAWAPAVSAAAGLDTAGR